MTSLYGAGYER